MATIKTGYTVVDGTGINYASLGTVTGLGAKLEKAIKSKKPVWLEGVINGAGKEIGPLPVALLKASNINIYSPAGNLKVNSSDVVSNLT